MTARFRTIALRAKGDWAHQVSQAFARELAHVGFLVTENLEEADAVVSLGGDGTFLATLRELGEHRYAVPVLGIHASPGRGFLLPLSFVESSAVDLSRLQALALSMKEDAWELEHRWGLVARVHLPASQRAADTTVWALNDIVVSRNTLSRLVRLKIDVDGRELFERLRGDGVILSSSVGSTGYSLSAGGPILDPTLKNILVTPVCPQSLAQRSVILGESSRVRVEILNHETPSYLTADGQQGVDLEVGAIVEVQRAEKPVALWVPSACVESYRNHFALLRNKLGFGGRF